MPTIRIDDDVYQSLQQKARPFVDTPNSVLRQMLGLDGAPPDPAGSGIAAGELVPLLQAGRLKVGETLEWKRRRAVHRATVTADGRLRLADGQSFDSPSGAAKFLAGYEVNGWRVWARAGDGVRLITLRDQHRSGL